MIGRNNFLQLGTFLKHVETFGYFLYLLKNMFCLENILILTKGTESFRKFHNVSDTHWTNFRSFRFFYTLPHYLKAIVFGDVLCYMQYAVILVMNVFELFGSRTFHSPSMFHFHFIFTVQFAVLNKGWVQNFCRNRDLLCVLCLFANCHFWKMISLIDHTP